MPNTLSSIFSFHSYNEISSNGRVRCAVKVHSSCNLTLAETGKFSMLSHRGLPQFPLLLAGLSSPFENLLRAAGLPTAPLAGGAHRTARLEALAGRILLFDSRNPDGRAGAHMVARYGLKRIDVASLIIRHRRWPVPNRTAAVDALLRASNWKEFDLFRRLKAEVERNGGIWLRLGDYPYPFQSAVCWSTEPAPETWRLLTDVFAIATESDRDADWLKRRYACRLPAFAIGSQAVAAMDAVRAAAALESGDFPLLWQTSLAEFARWWQIRNRIVLSVSTRDSVHEIRATGEFGEFRPILELWRGNRMATLPITSETTVIDERGIPFVLESSRNPGGCASVLAATSLAAMSFSTQSAITVEQQSA